MICELLWFFRKRAFGCLLGSSVAVGNYVDTLIVILFWVIALPAPQAALESVFFLWFLQFHCDVSQCGLLFILFELVGLWIWRFIHFNNFGKLSTIISSNIAFLPFCSFSMPIKHSLDCVVLSSISMNLTFLFFISLSLLHSGSHLGTLW